MGANPNPGRWRAVWISDVHLGTRHAQVDPLLQFLRVARPEILYIVGDLIDGWELRRGWFWADNHNTLIQKILRKSRKRTRVIYLTGNHDEFMEPFVGLRFGPLEIAREAIHVGLNGRRYLVVHGHQFDGLTHFNRLLERLGSGLYQVILDLNLWLNRLRRRLGMGYWSYAKFLKGRAKTAVRYVTGFEEAMTHLASARAGRRRHLRAHPSPGNPADRRAGLLQLRRLGRELYGLGGGPCRQLQPDPSP